MSELDAFKKLWTNSNLEELEGAVSPAQTIKHSNPFLSHEILTKETKESTRHNNREQKKNSSHSEPLEQLPILRIADIDSPPEDFTILGELGEGGMGRVQLAYQVALKRQVALKTIRKEIFTKDRALGLLHEAMVTGALEHPNIIPVYQLGKNNEGEPTLIMRKVEGVSWEVLIQDPNHPLWKSRKTWTSNKVNRNIEILMELCNAIHFAHKQGVLHRDIKPDNVMIGSFGEVYIVDWGIAIALQSGTSLAFHSQENKSPKKTIAGTPAFMAPEMLLNQHHRLSERTDVYLLGATLHFILTGTFRHSGDDLYQACLNAMQSSPVVYDNHIPKELGRICNKATQKEPELRYSSALEFRDALATYLEHYSSRELCNATQQSLQKLRDFLKKPRKQWNTKHALKVRQLFSECRFGFVQALHTWPKNPEANAGLSESLERMILFEISQRNYDAAATLFDELENPSESTKRKLSQLQTELSQEREEHSRLLHMAREIDLTVGTRQRTQLLLFLSGAIITLAVGLLYVVRKQHLVLTYPILLNTVGLGLALTSIAAWFWRRILIQHKANRKLVFLLLATMFSMLLSRFAGWTLALPIYKSLVFEFILLGLMMSAASLLFHRKLWLGSLLCWTLTLMSFVTPEYIYEFMVVITAFSWLYPTFILWYKNEGADFAL